MIQFQQWFGCDRILITDEVVISSIQVDFLKTEDLKEHYKADALIWALWVHEDFRECGVGFRLLKKAEELALKHGCNTVAVEWDNRESKQWVRDWYGELGYECKAFGSYSSLLVKDLRENNG